MVAVVGADVTTGDGSDFVSVATSAVLDGLELSIVLLAMSRGMVRILPLASHRPILLSLRIFSLSRSVFGLTKKLL